MRLYIKVYEIDSIFFYKYTLQYKYSFEKVTTISLACIMNLFK